MAAGKSVVYDANNNRHIFRKFNFDKTHEMGIDYLMVLVKTPLDISAQRIQTRGDGLDPAYPHIDSDVLLKIRNTA